MEAPFCLLDRTAPCDQDDGLYPPAKRLDAALAEIFLLLDSSSSLLLPDMDETGNPGNMGAALINARLSFLFLSNLLENFTFAAAAASCSEAGSSRIPRPLFLDAASSSATLFF